MLTTRRIPGSESALRILFLVVYMVDSCLCSMQCTQDNQCVYVSDIGRSRCWGDSSGWTQWGNYGSPGCYNIQGYATMVCGYKCCFNANPPWQSIAACAFPSKCVAGTNSTTGYAGMASAACVCCPAGKWSSLGETSCTSCGPGKYSIACSSSCSPCTTGTFSVGDGNPSCTPCNVGRYMFITGATTCSLCAAGKFSGQVGAASVTVCISCVPGKFSAVEGASSHTVCTDCPPGTYSKLNNADEVTKCNVPQCPAGQAPLSPSADLVEICSSDKICSKFSSTDISTSALEKWTLANIQSWRLGAPGKSCNHVCGDVGLTCHKTRFPRPSQVLTRRLLSAAGFDCSTMSHANNSGVLLGIYSRAPCIDNNGICWYFQGESRDETTGVVPESGYGDCELYEATDTRLCPCSVASQIPTNQVFEIDGSRCDTSLHGRYLYVEQWDGKPAYRLASMNSTVYLYFGQGNGWWYLSGRLGWTSSVKARRLGATAGFFESRTTPDDVPDFGWQELCDGGWIETNLSIRAETTSSVMGPWKGPSGRNLFCSTCRPGTYSAAGSTCRLCSAGTFSDSFNSTACLNCSAPAGHYCPQQSSLASGLICPVGYSCPGDVQDKLRCPSATYVGWSYCPEVITIHSSASGGIFAEVCPKTPVQNFGEPQYNRCELRWSWTDLYAGHENKSIIFKTGTVGEWAVYLHVSEGVKFAVLQHA
jgi:hypothetical protein